MALGRVARLLWGIARLLGRVPGLLLRRITRLLGRISGLLGRHAVAGLTGGGHSRGSSVTGLLGRVAGLLWVGWLLGVRWLLHHRLLHHWLLHHGLLHHGLLHHRLLHHRLRLLNNHRLDDSSWLSLSLGNLGLFGHGVSVRFESSLDIDLSRLLALVHQGEPFLHSVSLDQLAHFQRAASNLEERVRRPDSKIGKNLRNRRR